MSLIVTKLSCCGVSDIVLKDKLVVYDNDLLRIGWKDFDCKYIFNSRLRSLILNIVYGLGHFSSLLQVKVFNKSSLQTGAGFLFCTCGRLLAIFVLFFIVKLLA